MANVIRMKAPAKINLTLDVLGRRENGYHDLKMIMQTIDVYDELTITETGGKEIVLKMEEELPDKIPAEKNLVYKAAKLMQEKYALTSGFQIYLKKNIPAAAGLAGGSADCAATLLGINALCQLGLTKDELCELGVTLGADVPFCIRQGTMLSEGIGELLTPLPDMPVMWTLLIKPAISVSTASVYQAIDAKTIHYHPDTQKVIDAITKQNMLAISQNLSNVLETVTIDEYPIISELKEFLLQNGALGALMSGSGPTVYGLFRDRKLAEISRKEALYRYPNCDVILCRTRIP